MKNIPEKVKILKEARDRLRAKEEYGKADLFRKEIEKLGYKVSDKGRRSFVLPREEESPQGSFIVLFGSGEISPTGRKVHESIFNAIGKKEIRISIITTPAGFQPNVKTVYGEIGDFFSKRLINFNPKIDIIFANTKEEANDKNIISSIEKADYIFTGPGSPTYAANNLRDTLLLEKIIERVKEGATLSLASAAAIAFSRYCLPVYEIYKVGEGLHWKEGLNFFEEFWEPLTIVPHLNNKEGGRKNDTSFCFMGKERFQKIFSLLPRSEKVMGVDEETAVIFDIKKKSFSVRGKGTARYL